MISEIEATEQGWASLALIGDDGQASAGIHVHEGWLWVHISSAYGYTVEDLAALGRTFTRLSEQLAASGEAYL
jgi:hypothetical protein